VDFYGILGIGPDASTADIKRAYRRLARQYHPGINPGDRAAQERFARISEAYETLVDPGRRREYDAAGAPATAPQEVRTFEFTEFDFSVRALGAGGRRPRGLGGQPHRRRCGSLPARHYPHRPRGAEHARLALGI